jgi:plastocyanin
MRDDIRDRFFTPFVLPVTVIAVMLLMAFSFSRVLLAVSELGAALVAVCAALYILGMAFFVEARRRIPARTLGVALALGLISLIGAGAVAAAAGMRPLEGHGGEGGQAAGGEGQGDGGGADGGNEPLFVAVDIEFEQAPEALPPGDTTITLENNGAIEHNVTFEELGDEVIVEAAPGESATGEVTLEPGEYTYYCSIPGHRSTMEGTLTVEEGAGEASGGGGSSEAASEGAAGDASESGESGAGSSSEDGSER